MRLYWIVLVVLLVLSLAFTLCSCRMEDSYKEFVCENLEELNIEDCFSSSELSFARIDDIIIVPEIKEINHGEYMIYISAYSQKPRENIVIVSAIMKEELNTFFGAQLDQHVQLEQNMQNIYEGWVAGGTFTNENIELIDGKELSLIILVQVDGVAKEINYVINVKGYKSFVAST